MTEHKGLPVAGYKTQSQDKVDLVNANKAEEERILRRIDRLTAEAKVYVPEDAADPRWLAIARTHFEQAYMALNRAIFRPGRVALPEDEA